MMTMASAPAAYPHIVDELIAERAPRLCAHGSWPLLRPLLYRLLDYRKAVKMADAIAPLSGADAMEYISRLLDLRLEITGLDHLPKAGRCVLVANHPTGIGDGVALFDAVRKVRQDVCFYANADAERVCPRFPEVLIPVEWVLAKRTREKTRRTLTLTAQAMEAERALAIFPAGRLARVEKGKLVDPQWMASAVSVARKFEAPVIPVAMSGPYAFSFHTFNKISPELRDITLFHELLNKHARRFRLHIAPPIPTEQLGGDPQVLIDQIKAFVETRLGKDPAATLTLS